MLVDEVLRPALESAGSRPGRSVSYAPPTARRARARHAAAADPARDPARQRRDDRRGRLAAASGVRTLAHAQGGGVLYVHLGGIPERARALVRASLDRLGVCNRLNLLLVDRGAAALLPDLLAVLAEVGVDARGTTRAAAAAPVEELDVPLEHEWANDPECVATVTIDLVDDLGEAVAIANERTSGLAAGIVTEDAGAAERFFAGYRGTAAFWHAPTRFADGFEPDQAPETGINVDWTPGPRGP